MRKVLVVLIFSIVTAYAFCEVLNVTLIPSNQLSFAEGATKTDVLYLSPSISLDFILINLETKKYEVGVNPGVGYGIRWNPQWWQNIGSDFSNGYFLSMDMFISAGIADENIGIEGPDYFNINILPSVSVFNWFSIGYGIQYKIALNTVLDDTSNILFSFGIKKNI